MEEEFKERLKSLDLQHAKRRTPRYRSLLAHWAHRAIRPPARAKVAPLPIPKRKQVVISFAGHATILIRYHNLSILCDPHLSDWRGAVHREVRAGIAPAEVSDVDLILLSNQSPDHLDPKTLALLPRKATVIVPPGAAQHVSRFGFARVIELAPGQNVEHRRVDIYASPSKSIENSMAYVVRGEGPSVFFCGSSAYFEGFADIGQRFSPDIAILPIGGYAPNALRKQHMSPLDALYAFEDLYAKIMIPIRFGSFALSYEKLSDPSRWLGELINERNLEDYVIMIENGQSKMFIRPEDGCA